MKNFICFTILLFAINLKSQISFDIDLGVGLTTPNIQGAQQEVKNSVILTPVVGLYPNVTYNNFKLTGGIEFLTLKNRFSTFNDYEDYTQVFQRAGNMSKINIPISLGYEVNVNKVKFSPYIGWIYNVHMNYYERYSTLNRFESSGETIRIGEGNRGTYFGYKNSDRTQWIVGVNTTFLNKIGLDFAYVWGGNYTNIYYGCFDPLICIAAPYPQIKMGSEFRMTIKYTL